mmetsp:Transcript_28831/g.76007  ORF Transcript_28831/g.76007 Transcript_28831/m.76007 type:complete len:274 (-) Transcript_28831:59-880(-)
MVSHRGSADDDSDFASMPDNDSVRDFERFESAHEICALSDNEVEVERQHLPVASDEEAVLAVRDAVGAFVCEAADSGSECRVVHKDADSPPEQDGDAGADTETSFEEDPSVIGIFQFPAESVDTSLAPVPSRGHLSDVLSAPEISEISRGKKVAISTAAAGVGAVVLGTGGAVCGAVTGGLAGGTVGVVPALLTFGLSIPVGAAMGACTGLCTGAVTGGTTGLVLGGAAGYAGCNRWKCASPSTGDGQYQAGVTNSTLPDACTVRTGSSDCAS